MAETQRYTAVAIILHWAIAVAILGNVLIGWWMHDALEAPATQARAIAAYQLHKSIGLTVLVLSLLRLAWRLTHPVPALPAATPAWEKALARATHWAFYAIMIGLPLTGWLYASAAWSLHDARPLNVPTLYFGLFRVPHLFGLEHAALETRKLAAAAALFAHENFVRATVYLLLPLHVAAALKHHFRDRDAVLAHMLPGLRAPNEAPPPRDPRRAAMLMGGGAAILLAALAIALAFVSVPIAAPTAAAPVTQVAHNAPGDGEQHSDSIETAELREPEAAPAPVTAPAPATPAWRVDPAASEIAFSGVHAGAPFRGRFSRWRADIRFDPDNLTASHATVVIETASGSDGVPLHDEALPGAEWFDARAHPTATFRTTRIRRTGDGYAASGMLTIKGQAMPVDLPFSLTISGDRASMRGRARIDRAAANLGMASDPDAEYVSREIVVDVHVEAVRAR